MCVNIVCLDLFFRLYLMLVLLRIGWLVFECLSVLEFVCLLAGWGFGYTSGLLSFFWLCFLV